MSLRREGQGYLYLYSECIEVRDVLPQYTFPQPFSLLCFQALYFGDSYSISQHTPPPLPTILNLKPTYPFPFIPTHPSYTESPSFVISHSNNNNPWMKTGPQTMQYE